MSLARAKLIQSQVIRKYAEYPIRAIVPSSKSSRSRISCDGLSP